MSATIQRPRKGSRISTFYPVKELPPLSSLDSAFQLQEYISLLVRLDVHDVEKIVSIPGRRGEKESLSDSNQSETTSTEDKESGEEGKGDVVVDPACWAYEQLRRLAQDLSHPLITSLQQECTRQTCPEMKAGEWQYLCVAHGNDSNMESCCAIDYILHTVDSATALLNSPRAFPSRMSIPQTSLRHFNSLARRLGRIFAHAYFHHREIFEQCEAESSLYARFLALTSKFDLVPTEFLVIPSRSTEDAEPPRLLGAALDPKLASRPGDDDRGRGTEGRFDGPLGLVQPQSAPVERNPSPRKGRSRTDTMVFSEAWNVAEELARGEPEEDIHDPSRHSPFRPRVTSMARESAPEPEEISLSIPAPAPDTAHAPPAFEEETQPEPQVQTAAIPERTLDDDFSCVDPALAREREEPPRQTAAAVTSQPEPQAVQAPLYDAEPAHEQEQHEEHEEEHHEEAAEEEDETQTELGKDSHDAVDEVPLDEPSKAETAPVVQEIPTVEEKREAAEKKHETTEEKYEAVEEKHEAVEEKLEAAEEVKAVDTTEASDVPDTPAAAPEPAPSESSAEPGADDIAAGDEKEQKMTESEGAVEVPKAEEVTSTEEKPVEPQEAEVAG